MIKHVLILTTGLWLWSSSLMAATVSLTPSSSSLGNGEVLNLSITGTDFTTNTDGGGVKLEWDASVLSFVSITLDDPPWDTRFVNDVNADSGILDTIFLGNSDIGGIGGDFNIGTVIFNVIGIPGSSTAITTITISDADIGGGWTESNTIPVNTLDVGYNSANVNVVAPIPVPAAVWLFVSGIAGLGLFKKRMG